MLSKLSNEQYVLQVEGSCGCLDCLVIMRPYQCLLAYHRLTKNKYIKSQSNTMLPLLLFCLLTPILTQIATKTTLQALSSSTPTSLQSQAVTFLLKAHPQLSDYKVLQLNTSLSRGDQNYTDNLRDFWFELNKGDNTMVALVTLSPTEGQQFVSIAPLVSTVPIEGQPRPLGQYWITHYPSYDSTLSSEIDPTTNLPSSPINNRPPPPPGGYSKYTSLNDTLVQFALDYVASMHPNIVNYKIIQAFYQVVAGMNIKITYQGLDQFTNVTAIVSFSLQRKPIMTYFVVQCAKEEDCQRERAWDVFSAVDGLVVVHPELMAYRIVDFVIQDIGEQHFKIMVTFFNAKQSLRALTQIQVNNDKATVLSYFTYKYEE